MCSVPGAIIGGLQLAGSAMSAYGAYKEGRAKEDYYNAVAETNDSQAKEVLKSGVANQTLIQDQALRDTVTIKQHGKQVSAGQRASMAANGVALSSATAEDVQRDVFTQEKLDELAIRYSADQKTREIGDSASFQAKDLRKQAQLNRQSAREARQAGAFNLGATLLGSAGAVGSSWYGKKS
jgi:hypothetical protein